MGGRGREIFPPLAFRAGVLLAPRPAAVLGQVARRRWVPWFAIVTLFLWLWFDFDWST